MNTQEKEEPPGKSQHQPHRVRLPGFIKEEEIGLGDVIKRVTYETESSIPEGLQATGRVHPLPV